MGIFSRRLWELGRQLKGLSGKVAVFLALSATNLLT